MSVSNFDCQGNVRIKSILCQLYHSDTNLFASFKSIGSNGEVMDSRVIGLNSFNVFKALCLFGILFGLVDPAYAAERQLDDQVHVVHETEIRLPLNEEGFQKLLPFFESGNSKVRRDFYFGNFRNRAIDFGSSVLRLKTKNQKGIWQSSTVESKQAIQANNLTFLLITYLREEKEEKNLKEVIKGINEIEASVVEPAEFARLQMHLPKLFREHRVPIKAGRDLRNLVLAEWALKERWDKSLEIESELVVKIHLGRALAKNEVGDNANSYELEIEIEGRPEKEKIPKVLDFVYAQILGPGKILFEDTFAPPSRRMAIYVSEQLVRGGYQEQLTISDNQFGLQPLQVPNLVQNPSSKF